MKPLSFVDYASAELDRLAAEIRRDPRRQLQLRGLRPTELLEVFFQERAGETGSR